MPRVAQRDFGTSLLFKSANNSKVTPGANITLSGEFAVTWWEKRTDNATQLRSRFGAVVQSSKVTVLNSLFFIRVIDGGASSNVVPLPPLGKWSCIALTRDSNNKVDITIDNVTTRLFGDTAQVGNFVINQIGISQNSGAFEGYMDAIKIWNVYKSPADLLALRNEGKWDTTNLILNYRFNEGSGTVAIDESVNPNNGTITACTYTSDVAIKPRVTATGRVPVSGRDDFNQNIIVNGNFEQRPVGNVATTTSTTYVDGRASGTNQNLGLGGWAFITGGTAGSVAYDSNVKYSGTTSLRLSTGDTSVTVTAGQGRVTGFPPAIDLEWLDPNRAYTLTAMCKTNNAASLAAYIEIREYDAAGSTTSTRATNKLSAGTNDWTQLSLTFTTNPFTRSARLFLRNNVAGSVSDVWFDEIRLVPVVGATRVPIS